MTVHTKKQTLMNLKLKELKELARLEGHSGKGKKEELAGALSKKLSSKKIHTFTKIYGGGDTTNHSISSHSADEMGTIGELLRPYLNKDLKILVAETSTTRTDSSTSILISQYIGIITNYGNGITADTFISNLILKLLRVLNTMNMNLNMPRNNKVEVDRKVDRKVDKKLIEKLIKMLIILKLIQNAEKLKIRGVTKIQIEHIPEIQITMTSIFTPPAEIISKQTIYHYIYDYVNKCTLKTNIRINTFIKDEIHKTNIYKNIDIDIKYMLTNYRSQIKHFQLYPVK
jgi:hypothetical protein